MWKYSILIRSMSCPFISHQKEGKKKKKKKKPVLSAICVCVILRTKRSSHLLTTACLCCCEVYVCVKRGVETDGKSKWTTGMSQQHVHQVAPAPGKQTDSVLSLTPLIYSQHRAARANTHQPKDTSKMHQKSDC